MECLFAHADFGDPEREAVARVLQGSWLAAGPENEAFEKEFATHLGAKEAVCVNSGSSANLLALASLELPLGSQILTAACGFPATLAPILHLKHRPIFIDYDLKTHNINVDHLIRQMPHARAALFAHTLGNPVDMKELTEASIWTGCLLIEDCCEALGTTIQGNSVGTFGLLGTFSFYPSHQITALGGGGMVVTNDIRLAQRMRSMRDWGKIIPEGYQQGKHLTAYEGGYYPGYTYDTVGYNFKLPDANAAFGRVQLKRLNGFVKRRIANYRYLAERLKGCSWLEPVKELPTARTSWFGYPLTLNEGDRNAFGAYLESHGIRHRPFFAGNILRHRPFRHLGTPDNFPVADSLMQHSCFVGVWQGLTREHLDYMGKIIRAWTPTISAS